MSYSRDPHQYDPGLSAQSNPTKRMASGFNFSRATMAQSANDSQNSYVVQHSNWSTVITDTYPVNPEDGSLTTRLPTRTRFASYVGRSGNIRQVEEQVVIVGDNVGYEIDPVTKAITYLSQPPDASQNPSYRLPPELQDRKSRHDT